MSDGVTAGNFSRPCYCYRTGAVAAQVFDVNDVAAAIEWATQ